MRGEIWQCQERWRSRHRQNTARVTHLAQHRHCRIKCAVIPSMSVCWIWQPTQKTCSFYPRFNIIIALSNRVFPGTMLAAAKLISLISLKFIQLFLTVNSNVRDEARLSVWVTAFCFCFDAGPEPERPPTSNPNTCTIKCLYVQLSSYHLPWRNSIFTLVCFLSSHFLPEHSLWNGNATTDALATSKLSVPHGSTQEFKRMNEQITFQT